MIATKTLILFLLSQNLAFGSYVSPRQYYDPTRHLFLTNGGTTWDFFSPNDATSKTTNRDRDLQFVARSPFIIEDGLQPTLTLRLDRGNWNSARAYGERWLKEFPKFGYELQMSRDTTLGGLKGFEIELNATRSKHVIRQLIVKANQEFWVFTCTSDQKHFSVTWSACEHILKTAQVH